MRRVPNGAKPSSRRRSVLLMLAALGLAGAVRTTEGLAIPAKAAVAQVLLEHAFDRSRSEHRAQRPWPSADMMPVARIRVPRLGVGRIVLDTGSGQAMAFGPTLLPGGAKLGSPGVSVIAAHRDTHFHFLHDVARGDLIEVERLDGSTLRYRVSGREIVRWDRFSIPRDQPVNALALTTCYPFDVVGHGSFRYVVHAEPVT